MLSTSLIWRGYGQGHQAIARLTTCCSWLSLSRDPCLMEKCRNMAFKAISKRFRDSTSCWWVAQSSTTKRCKSKMNLKNRKTKLNCKRICNTNCKIKNKTTKSSIHNLITSFLFRGGWWGRWVLPGCKYVMKIILFIVEI